MMTPTDLLCDNIFQAALSAPIGVLVRTNNAQRCQMRLYQFRSKNANSEYTSVIIDTSPDDEQYDLWIGTDERLRYSTNTKAPEPDYEEIEV